MSGYAASQPGGAAVASTVCRYYTTQGKCFYGDECKFEHAGPGGSESAAPAAATWQSQSSDGDTQPASAAYTVPAAAASAAQPGAAAPVSKPLSSLAARAKEWTPTSNTSSPPSAKPSAAASSTSSTTTPTSISTSASSGALKLNPNKTPFKPSVDAAARPFVPGGGGGGGAGGSGSRLNNRVAAFVPLDEVTNNMGSMHLQQQLQYDDDGGFDDGGNQQLDDNDQGDDDQDQYDLQQQHVQYGGDSSNPYAAPEPFGGAMMHQLDDDQQLDDDPSQLQQQQQHMLQQPQQPGSFIPPHTYTSYADFAASAMPVGGAHGRPLPGSGSDSADQQQQYPASYGLLRPTPRGAGGRGGGGGIFMDDVLRARLTLGSHLQCARLQPDDPLFATLPTTLDHDRYHSLLPLAADEPPQDLMEASTPSSSSSSSWYARTNGGSIMYKVTSAVDGRSYVVKRLLACRLSEDRGRSLVRGWTELGGCYGSGSGSSGSQQQQPKWGPGPAHPNIIAVRGAFFSKDFGPPPSPDGSVPSTSSASSGPGQGVLCLVYDFHPTASALHPCAQGSSLQPETLWHYLLQLLAALRAIHDHNASTLSSSSSSASSASSPGAAPLGPLLNAHGLLQPGRVLITSDNRLRLSGCGVAECLSAIASPSAAAAAAGATPAAAEVLGRRRDFQALGCLMLGWMGLATQAAQLHDLLQQQASQSSAPAPPPPSSSQPRSKQNAAAIAAANAAAAAATAAAAVTSSAISTLLTEVRTALASSFPSGAAGAGSASSSSSDGLVDVVLALLSPTSETTCASLSGLPGVLKQLSRSYTAAMSREDFLEEQLTKELQNARLFRLMVKLGFVNERPDTPGGSSWSETGDRYLLSLFRDLVFHSVHDGDSSGSGASAGVPNMDWGHVIHQLNLLDAGSQEKTLLTSRDGEAMMVVRYSDLKRSVDDSYEDLLRHSHMAMQGHAYGDVHMQQQQMMQQQGIMQLMGGQRGGQVIKSSLLRPHHS